MIINHANMLIYCSRNLSSFLFSKNLTDPKHLNSKASDVYIVTIRNLPTHPRQMLITGVNRAVHSYDHLPAVTKYYGNEVPFSNLPDPLISNKQNPLSSFALFSFLSLPLSLCLSCAFSLSRPSPITVRWSVQLHLWATGVKAVQCGVRTTPWTVLSQKRVTDMGIATETAVTVRQNAPWAATLMLTQVRDKHM